MSDFRAQPQHAERDVPEARDRKPVLDRDAYTVDRDRILQSKAFRRMRGKTQVFVSSLDDHVRTRLTHTLEVSQLARSLARATRLNEILVEAAAYGHDLGHTPFGHIGERTLHEIVTGKVPLSIGTNRVFLELGGFKHNVQSLRQVSRLETHQTAWEPDRQEFANPLGLNLTKQSRWAMVVHTSIGWKPSYHEGVKFYWSDLEAVRGGFTLEALALALADEIAQRHHDLVDGFLVDLVTEEEVDDALRPLLDALSSDRFQAFKDQMDVARQLSKSTGEMSRQGAVISKHAANALVLLGHNYLASAIDRFVKAYRSAGGTLGNYLSIEDEVWVRTLENLEGDPSKWSDHPLGLQYGVLDRLSKTTSGANWTDPKNWDNGIGVCLHDLTQEKVVRSADARRMDAKASFLVRQLVAAYIRNPELLPTRTLASIGVALGLDPSGAYHRLALEVLKILKETLDSLNSTSNDRPGDDRRIHYESSDGDERRLAAAARVIVDHVAGMTDNYAAAEHARLYDASSAIY